MIWAQAFIGMSLQVVSWWIEQENVPIEDVAASLSDLALHGMAAPARRPAVAPPRAQSRRPRRA